MEFIKCILIVFYYEIKTTQTANKLGEQQVLCCGSWKVWHDRLDGRSGKENTESLVYDSLNKLIIGILTSQRIPYICIQMPQVWKYMYKLIIFPVSFIFKKKIIFLIQIWICTSKNPKRWDFPADPVVKNSLANSGDMGSIPGLGTEIPHVLGQLSLPATATAEAHAPTASSLQ